MADDRQIQLAHHGTEGRLWAALLDVADAQPEGWRDGSHIGELTLAHLNQVPGVLVVLGLAALLFGTIPRAVPAAWALVGYGFFTGTFGPLLGLPEVAYRLSPFEHAARMPLESFALPPLLALSFVAAAGVLVGLFGLRRRGIDIA